MSEHPAKDQVFITKLSEIVLANLEDENFSVKELCQKAGISHYGLKRRLQAITGKTIKQFIREVRLQKAMEILRHEEVNISEVAYSVGFSSPAYFNTCFHGLFGYPPGAVRKGDFVNTLNTKSLQIEKKKYTRRALLLISSGFLVVATLIFLTYRFLYRNPLREGGIPVRKTDKSIAVLPFKNLSEPVANQYFIDGLMEEIHSKLGSIHDLRVVSRTSAEKFRNNTVNSIHEIARELRVNYIVEGSGQKFGKEFRLTVKLFRATRKETCLWVKSYEQEVNATDDLFKITSSIAQTIAEALQAVITPEEKQRIEKVPTRDLSALDFYLKGREEEGKFPYYDLTASSFAFIADLTPLTEQSIKRAEKMYRMALEYDSAFTLAYTGLASIYWRKNYYDEYFTENFLDSVLLLAEKALSFNDQLPDVYFIRAMYYGEKGDNKHALQDFDKALNLNPNYWLAYYGKGSYVDDNLTAIKNLLEAASRHHGSGLAEILEKISFRLSETGFTTLAKKFSIETMKLKLDSASYYFWLWMYEFDYKKCFVYYERRYSMDSTDLTAIEFLSDYYQITGQFTKALEFQKRQLSRLKLEGSKSFNSMHRVGYAYAKNGLGDRADYYFNKQMAYCNDAIRLGLPYGISLAYYDLAGIYAYKGNKTKAYKNLRMFYKRSGRYFLWVVRFMKIDPLFNSIRKEPEFQKIENELDAKYNAEHERVGKWLKEQRLL